MARGAGEGRMEWPPGRVLVAHDLSDDAGDALEAAARIAGDPTRVDVLYVVARVDPDHPAIVWPAQDDGARRAHALAAIERDLGRRGLGGARVHLADGAPGRAIVEAAGRLGAGLVVVASHGRTGLRRLALGSVAERVVRQAPCPVLVIRRDPRRGRPAPASATPG